MNATNNKNENFKPSPTSLVLKQFIQNQLQAFINFM